MFSAIIVAAGGSRRMGFDKLSALLAGKPVLAHTVDAFCNCSTVDEIILVCSTENENWVKEIASTATQSDKITAVVRGGAERHFSVWNGIEATNPAADLIGVHDGARPLVTSEAITMCAMVAKTTGAATLGHPITDTVKRCDADDFVGEPVDRNGLWAMETPQIFHASVLRNAYQTILASGELVTDEVSAVQAISHPVKVVASDRPNLKITYPADLALASRLIADQL
ncbi:MAG: 2-C-methyl-D-erythritol 4-phosphate cytidylyltransferase [Verrucomicrobiales bacterium]